MVEVDVSLIKVDWGGDETRGPVSKLGKEIEGLIIKQMPPRKVTKPRIEPTSYEMFAGGYELLPTFGIFPFFLLPERRFNWDIFQYGVQTRVGLSWAEQMEDSLLDSLLRRFHDEVDITPDMFRELISRISLHNRDRKNQN